jgi:multidrug efflux system membrane fusion protein
VTRTFLIKAALPADTPDLVLGSTVTVRQASTTQSASQMRLPGTALRWEAGKTSVWVLDAATMTVRSQAVEVDTADGNDAVVRSGLQAGDEVVVSGVHVLTPGQKVTRYVAR